MRKRRLPKGVFSKIVVVFCVIEMAVMQFWAMRIASHNAFLTTGLLTANHGVFGGELLLLCLKRIFAKSDEKDDAESDNSEL